GFHSVRRPFIDRDGLTARRITRDHPCDDGFAETGLLKSHQAANTLCFKDGFALHGDLQLQVVILLLKALIFIIYTDQSDVSAPKRTEAVKRTIGKFLHRSQGIDDPFANETGIDAVASLEGN